MRLHSSKHKSPLFNPLQSRRAGEDLLNECRRVLEDLGFSSEGKTKRVGYHTGKTSDWKKAIVTIETNPAEVSYLAKGGKATKATKKFKDSRDEFMGA